MKNLILILNIILFSCLTAFGQSSFDRWVPISGTNTYTTSITSFPSSYNNTKIYGQFTNGNTGNATFQIPALGVIPIRKWDGDSWELLASGDIDAGDYAELVYDNSNAYFRLTIIKAAGSGFASTPTLQQVITAGSVLTGNNEITGPRNTSIQVGDETTGGIHGIEATADQVVLKSDTFYIQDIAGGNTIYSDNGIDESGIARGGDQIVFNGTTGITLTTDNTDGIKVSGGGTLAQTSGLLTKAQVGDYITSRQFKKSVKASSTANIADLNNAGASMDGITLSTQDRVLLKDQSTGSQNGIYNVVSLTPTVLTRVGDFSSSTFEGVLTNSLVLVDEGTANGGRAYRLSTTGAITIGTTALTFTEFGAAGGANSGIYTPTLTNVTNIAASTAYECQYLRVGNTVTVSGKVDIDVTIGAASELGMALPIASAFTADTNLGGTASSPAAASLVSAVRADATNDRAAFVFTAVSLTNDSYWFEFTYQIK